MSDSKCRFALKRENLSQKKENEDTKSFYCNKLYLLLITVAGWRRWLNAIENTK
jgi:hypothetical protein